MRMKVPSQKQNTGPGRPCKVPAKKKATKEKIEPALDECEDISVVGSSLSTSVRGVKELIQAISVGTQEDILVNECSLIYECRVCHNLFRSVANFLSHKRAFCKKQYQYLTHGFFNGQVESREPIEVQREPSAKDVNWSKNGEVTGRSRVKTSVSEAVTALQRSPPVTLLSRFVRQNETQVNTVSEEESLLCRLEEMQSSGEAVFQTLLNGDSGSSNSIQDDLSDLQSNGKVREAVILEDGHVAKPNGSHCCNVCDASFRSDSLLKRHELMYHNPRTCYPCPICKVFLASPWGVYRHLNKTHHRSEEQIRRLRPQILGKGKKRNLYEASKQVDVAEADLAKIDAKEEEKWIAQFEGDLHCTTCGKSFSRRVALNVHSAKCKPVAQKPSKPEPEPVGPQICPKCGVEFGRKAVLAVHLQSCNGLMKTKNLRAHPCAYCGRTFARRHALTLHLVRCPKAPVVSPRSPLSLLLTPPKLTPRPASMSPSSIVIRRDYIKSSPVPILTQRCFCPERCAIHLPLPKRLEAVVRKLQVKSVDPVNEPSCSQQGIKKNEVALTETLQEPRFSVEPVSSEASLTVLDSRISPVLSERNILNPASIDTSQTVQQNKLIPNPESTDTGQSSQEDLVSPNQHSAEKGQTLQGNQIIYCPPSTETNQTMQVNCINYSLASIASNQSLHVHSMNYLFATAPSQNVYPNYMMSPRLQNNQQNQAMLLRYINPGPVLFGANQTIQTMLTNPNATSREPIVEENDSDLDSLTSTEIGRPVQKTPVAVDSSDDVEVVEILETIEEVDSSGDTEEEQSSGEFEVEYSEVEKNSVEEVEDESVKDGEESLDQVEDKSDDEILIVYSSSIPVANCSKNRAIVRGRETPFKVVPDVVDTTTRESTMLVNSANSCKLPVKTSSSRVAKENDARERSDVLSASDAAEVNLSTFQQVHIEEPRVSVASNAKTLMVEVCSNKCQLPLENGSDNHLSPLCGQDYREPSLPPQYTINLKGRKVHGDNKLRETCAGESLSKFVTNTENNSVAYFDNEENKPFVGFDQTDILYNVSSSRMKKVVEINETELESWMRNDDKKRERLDSGISPRNNSRDNCHLKL